MKPSLLFPAALALVAGALQLHACGGYDTLPRYRAHEWGTFTSVVGSDGAPIHWNPFVAVDLPGFVYRREAALRGPEHAAAQAKLDIQAALTKNSRHWLQRMETPVIYFHANQPMTVSATVKFPRGLVTEWYPQAHAFGPVIDLPGLLPGTNLSYIRWDNVAIGAKDDTVKFPVGDAPANHYFHARHTAANPLVARSPLMTQTEQDLGQAEKFLFYRGAGNFATPLAVQFEGEDRLVLQNTGSEPMLDLQVFEGRGLSGTLTTVDVLKPGERLPIALKPAEGNARRPEQAAELRRRLKDSLTRAGLFADEAESMLATWESDWFDDDGLRVLFPLPRGWTDETLPLELSPAPASLVRVMIGRAELIRPSTETRLREMLSDYGSGKTQAALAEMRRLVEPRFLEPALNRVEQMERRAALIRYGLNEGTSRAHPAFNAEMQRRASVVQEVQAAFTAQLQRPPVKAVAQN